MHGNHALLLSTLHYTGLFSNLTMSANASLFATIHGRVQGVYFRAFVQQQATNLGLTGYVKNLLGGRSVEIQAEGERERLEDLLKLLYVGPQGAVVERVETKWSAYSGQFDEFEVRFR